jgi:hypothetical protein
VLTARHYAAGARLAPALLCCRLRILLCPCSPDLFPHPPHCPAYPSMSASASTSTGYVCDTLPAPRLAGRSPPPAPPARSPSPGPSTLPDFPIVDAGTLKAAEHDPEDVRHPSDAVPFAPPGRKLCVRHQRMADEGTNLKLQKVRADVPGL